MKINFNEYKMSDIREKKLWKESIIVFDSSALLDIYFLPKATREKIFENHFNKKLNGRLWIPSHVGFEYKKNREQIIQKPISEKYKPLDNEIFAEIKKNKSNIMTRIKDLKNRTKNADKHPYLIQEDIDKYLEIFNIFFKESENLEKNISNQISKIEEEIKNLAEDDDVLIAIEKYFQIGRTYEFKEKMNIAKIGKNRYEHLIPPGYKDQKDKKGFQIFGDLIIWKQIIEYASITKKSILFICNDLKEDWCYLEDDGTEKRIKSPREELIQEIRDEANVEFWMYNLPQFLYKSNEYLFTDEVKIIEDDKILNFSNIIEDVKYLKKTNKRKRVIIDDFSECKVCSGNKDGFGNYINQWVNTLINNEYPNTHYNSQFNSAYTGNCEYCNTLHIECPKCKSVTAIDLCQFEEKVECESGCGIIYYVESDYNHHGLDNYEIKIIDHRINKCSHCGEDYINDDENTGICKRCDENYGTEN